MSDSCGVVTFQAHYPYDGSVEQSQLSFKSGDYILCDAGHVSEQTSGDWLYGSLSRTGDAGWFPKTYVIEIVTTAPSQQQPQDSYSFSLEQNAKTAQNASMQQNETSFHIMSADQSTTSKSKLSPFTLTVDANNEDDPFAALAPAPVALPPILPGTNHYQASDTSVCSNAGSTGIPSLSVNGETFGSQTWNVEPNADAYGSSTECNSANASTCSINGSTGAQRVLSITGFEQQNEWDNNHDDVQQTVIEPKDDDEDDFDTEFQSAEPKSINLVPKPQENDFSEVQTPGALPQDDAQDDFEMEFQSAEPKAVNLVHKSLENDFSEVCTPEALPQEDVDDFEMEFQSAESSVVAIDEGSVENGEQAMNKPRVNEGDDEFGSFGGSNHNESNLHGRSLGSFTGNNDSKVPNSEEVQKFVTSVDEDDFQDAVESEMPLDIGVEKKDLHETTVKAETKSIKSELPSPTLFKSTKYAFELPSPTQIKPTMSAFELPSPSQFQSTKSVLELPYPSNILGPLATGLGGLPPFLPDNDPEGVENVADKENGSFEQDSESYRRKETVHSDGINGSAMHEFGSEIQNEHDKEIQSPLAISTFLENHNDFLSCEYGVNGHQQELECTVEQSFESFGSFEAHGPPTLGPSEGVVDEGNQREVTCTEEVNFESFAGFEAHGTSTLGLSEGVVDEGNRQEVTCTEEVNFESFSAFEAHGSPSLGLSDKGCKIMNNLESFGGFEAHGSSSLGLSEGVVDEGNQRKATCTEQENFESFSGFEAHGSSTLGLSDKVDQQEAPCTIMNNFESFGGFEAHGSPSLGLSEGVVDEGNQREVTCTEEDNFESFSGFEAHGSPSLGLSETVDDAPLVSSIGLSDIVVDQVDQKVESFQVEDSPDSFVVFEAPLSSTIASSDKVVDQDDQCVEARAVEDSFDSFGGFEKHVTNSSGPEATTFNGDRHEVACAVEDSFDSFGGFEKHVAYSSGPEQTTFNGDQKEVASDNFNGSDTPLACSNVAIFNVNGLDVKNADAIEAVSCFDKIVESKATTILNESFGEFDDLSSDIHQKTKSQPLAEVDADFENSPSATQQDTDPFSSNGGDGFGDFGDFESIPTTSEPVANMQSGEATEEGDDFGDFGDFDSSPVEQTEEPIKSQQKAESGGDWGDFGSSPIQQTDTVDQVQHSADDDWGDFDVAQFSEVTEPSGAKEVVEDDFGDFHDTSPTDKPTATEVVSTFATVEDDPAILSSQDVFHSIFKPKDYDLIVDSFEHVSVREVLTPACVNHINNFDELKWADDLLMAVFAEVNALKDVPPSIIKEKEEERQGCEQDSKHAGNDVSMNLSFESRGTLEMKYTF